MLLTIESARVGFKSTSRILTNQYFNLLFLKMSIFPKTVYFIVKHKAISNKLRKFKTIKMI